MTRILRQGDRERTIEFLNQDHEINMMMIFDIENHGIENRGALFQGDYYGAFKDGKMRGVSCLYNFGSMLIYAPDEQLMPDLLDHMARLKRRPTYLNARTAWAEEVLYRLEEQGIRPKTIEQQEYMALTKESFKPRSSHGARFAGPNDLESIMKLHQAFQIEYFGRYSEAEEEMGRMAEGRMAESGIVVAQVRQEIVAKAEVLVSTRRMALIGGVYTLPQYRGQGFSTACTSLLCEKTIENREKACLNVASHNLPAIRLYRGLGFEPICEYLMALFP